MCKKHYGTKKQTDGHDPSYDGIQYYEVDEDAEEDEATC
jgi:hypothetical protein